MTGTLLRGGGRAKSRRKGSSPSRRGWTDSSYGEQPDYRPPRGKVRTLKVTPALPRRRVVALMAAVAVIATGLVTRLAYFQLDPPQRLVQLAEDQSHQTVKLKASRGAIVDRNGLDFVISSVSQSVVVDPSAMLVEEIPAAAEQLATIFRSDPTSLTERLIKAKERKSQFEYIARQIDDNRLVEVKALLANGAIGGLFLIPEPVRHYPGGMQLARSVIGDTDIDNVGLFGIERQYNEVLKGKDGKLTVEAGVKGQTIPGTAREEVKAQEGSRIVLSLHKGLQLETENILLRAVDRIGALNGVAIVTKVGTGEVLANATVSRVPGSVAKPSVENRAATWAFEPGSIMKALTVSAIIDSGSATATTTKEVPAKLELHDVEFVDDPWHKPETYTLAEVIERSSNVGTIMFTREMTAKANSVEVYHRYMANFGIGSVTGTGFPGESAGFLGNFNNWNGIFLSSSAIGQGASATPLQMIGALNAIANDGRYVAPNYVLGTVDSRGNFQKALPPDQRQVISPASAQAVTDILKKVVATGTGVGAKVDGFTVAGKTGTAWKPQADPDPEDAYLDKNKVRHLAPSFMGYFPADDPQVSILVILDDVTDREMTGGKVAAPVFGEIAAAAVRELEMSPTRDAPVARGRVKGDPEPFPVRYDPSLTTTTDPSATTVPSTTVKGPATTKPTATTKPATTTRAATTTSTTVKPSTTTTATKTTIRTATASGTPTTRSTTTRAGP